MSDFLAILLRYFNLFTWSLVRRGTTKRPRVFHVQICRERGRSQKKNHRLTVRMATGELKDIAVAANTILMKTTIQTTTEIWPPQERDINTKAPEIGERKIVKCASPEISHRHWKMALRRKARERSTTNETGKASLNKKQGKGHNKKRARRSAGSPCRERFHNTHSGRSSCRQHVQLGFLVYLKCLVMSLSASPYTGANSFTICRSP